MTNATAPARRLYETLQESNVERDVFVATDDPTEQNLESVCIDGRFNLEKVAAAVYPFESGDHTVIGPECFTDGERISYRGENYIKLPDVAERSITVSTGGTAALKHSPHGDLVILDHPDAPDDMRHYEVGRIVLHGGRRGFQSAPFSVGAISPETLRAIAALIEADQ